MYFTEYEISLMPDGDRQVLYQEPSDGERPYWSPGSHRSQQFSTESPGGARGHLGEERGGQTSLQAGEGKRKREHQEKQQRHHGLLSSGSSYRGNLGQTSSLLCIIILLIIQSLMQGSWSPWSCLSWRLCWTV